MQVFHFFKTYVSQFRVWILEKTQLEEKFTLGFPISPIIEARIYDFPLENEEFVASLG
jgi:hypothetical protein